VLSLGYLIFFGSLVAFSAYVWLLRVSTPARVSTYAFVNPVVAVVLGYVLAGEPLTPRTMVAAAVIVAAVVLITRRRGTAPARVAVEEAVSIAEARIRERGSPSDVEGCDLRIAAGACSE